MTHSPRPWILKGFGVEGSANLRIGWAKGANSGRNPFKIHDVEFPRIRILQRKPFFFMRKAT